MDCCSPVAEVHAATLTLWAALGVGLTTSLATAWACADR